MTRPAVLSISAISLSLGLMLTCTLPARADGPDPCVADALCREHEDKGIAYSANKDYASALVEFQAAYTQAPIPRLLINIGRSLFRLGQPKEALKYYTRFSRAEPYQAPEVSEKVRRYVAEAEAAISAAPSITETQTHRPETKPEQPPPEERKAPAPVAPARAETRVEANEPILAHPPQRAFPAGPVTLLGVGVAGLAVGLGLGAVALGLTGQVVDNPGPFDNDLYNRGIAINQAAIALDVIGGASLAAGGIWLGVWLSRHRHPSGIRSEASRERAITRGGL